MGLKNSEHISKIVIHPENSEIIWVAAQGPLWSKGGDRGIFKTMDGGNNWKQVLGNNEWTGATELVIDPRNPDRMYAATWDRHRTVATYMGGGPGTALHRSMDGGESWQKHDKWSSNIKYGQNRSGYICPTTGRVVRCYRTGKKKGSNI